MEVRAHISSSSALEKVDFSNAPMNRHMDDLVSRFSQLSLSNLPELPGDVVRQIYRYLIVWREQARAAGRIQASARGMRPRLLWRANVFDRIRIGYPRFINMSTDLRNENQVRNARSRIRLARSLIRRNDLSPGFSEFNFATGRSIFDGPNREPGFRG
jgi:hypothetical protein